jgi:hypothetical protein
MQGDPWPWTLDWKQWEQCRDDFTAPENVLVHHFFLCKSRRSFLIFTKEFTSTHETTKN